MPDPALAKPRHSWSFLAAAPAREVFAVMEQMLGTLPFRYEVTGDDSARIIEVERCSFLFGHWRKLETVGEDGSRRSKGRVRPRWVTVRAEETRRGTEVSMEASRGRGAVPRALQLVLLLTRGNLDRCTVYRERRIPDGPTTLVASWAGTAYPIYLEPSWDAPRGEAVLTASPLVAIGNDGPFVKVRLPSGVEGYIERDQLVPAPAVASRAAQPRTAVHG